eukprot:14177413-Alexandrium_andersonii.AAC.1
MQRQVRSPLGWPRGPSETMASRRTAVAGGRRCSGPSGGAALQGGTLGASWCRHRAGTAGQQAPLPVA